MKLYFQNCVLHGVGACMLLLGCIAMMSNAYTTKSEWIYQMIIDMMDPSNYNNNYYKDAFLGRMYKIVNN